MNLYEKLLNYSTSKYPMHMPGHKRNPMFSMDNPYVIDVTEVEGTDNLHEPEGVIAELLEKMRELYRTKDSFLLVNGSTCGILAAISASCQRGDTVVVARNCHRSVYHAIYLLELNPVYVTPNVDEYTGISYGIEAQVIEQKLGEHPEAKAVILTSPTYEGVLSDIQTIAEVTHKNDQVLIVDEAHGAHLNWMNEWPTAMEQGADLVIESLHKTLPALTQTGVLHRCTERVSKEAIERYLDIYETSSPSYVLMASVAQCMEWLEINGKKEFVKYEKRLKNLRQEAEKWKKINLWKCPDMEPSKLVIDTSKTTWNGEKLAGLLRERGIETEMAAASYVIAMTSVADSDEGFEKLSQALEELDEKATLKTRTETAHMVYQPEIACHSYMAMNGKVLEVNIDESVGKISAEYVMVYPPGIPFLVPGEIIDEEVLKRVEIAKKEGLNLTGLHDKKAEKIRIVER